MYWNSDSRAEVQELPEIKPLSLKEATESILASFGPDLIAISVCFPVERIAKTISRVAKAVMPEVTVLWGGPQVTSAPAEALALGADFVNVGEGLVSFERFLEVFAQGGDLTQIANLGFRRNGQDVLNPLLPLRPNLDDNPYLDYSLFEERHFLKSFVIP